jgi:SAM-dependent methyltransferase
LTAQTNQYSSHWIDLFLQNITPAQTQREVDFLRQQLSRDRFTRVLDICCGPGRHAGALAAAGYQVVGIDGNAHLIAQASAAHPAARFIAMDMRELAQMNQVFDAAICMWQSFGYFDATTNDRILSDIASLLSPGGRLILDIYNRAFFENSQGSRQLERSGQRITENKQLIGNRLHVELIYPNEKSDVFDWQIFDVDEIAEHASRHQMRAILCCTDFDAAISASASTPRMQIVLEKQ